MRYVYSYFKTVYSFLKILGFIELFYTAFLIPTTTELALFYVYLSFVTGIVGPIGLWVSENV